MTQRSDADLVVACLAGEPEAWAELINRYSRYVMAIVVRGYGLAEHAAEEIHQEVFVRTHLHLGRLRNPDALKPWIAQLARRLCMDHLRATARIAENAEVDDLVSEDVLARLDLALTVRQAMAKLPPDTAEILDRFFARDQSYATISETMGIAPGTIGSRISRGLARLRAELE